MKKGVLLLSIVLAVGSADAERKPNVLLIMTDDQGYGDLGFHGNDRIDTPVLDRLAGQSVRFDRFLSARTARRHAPP